MKEPQTKGYCYVSSETLDKHRESLQDQISSFICEDNAIELSRRDLERKQNNLNLRREKVLAKLELLNDLENKSINLLNVKPSDNCCDGGDCCPTTSKSSNRVEELLKNLGVDLSPDQLAMYTGVNLKETLWP